MVGFGTSAAGGPFCGAPFGACPNAGIAVRTEMATTSFRFMQGSSDGASERRRIIIRPSAKRCNEPAALPKLGAAEHTAAEHGGVCVCRIGLIMYPAAVLS